SSANIVIPSAASWREESAFSKSRQLQIPRYARNDNRCEVRSKAANGVPARSSLPRCGALRGGLRPPCDRSPPANHAEFSPAPRQKYESPTPERAPPVFHRRPEL